METKLGGLLCALLLLAWTAPPAAAAGATETNCGPVVELYCVTATLESVELTCEATDTLVTCALTASSTASATVDGPLPGELTMVQWTDLVVCGDGTEGTCDQPVTTPNGACTWEAGEGCSLARGGTLTGSQELSGGCWDAYAFISLTASVRPAEEVGQVRAASVQVTALDHVGAPGC